MKQPLDEWLKCRVSREQLAAIHSAAHIEGITPSEYVRRSLPPFEGPLATELKQLRLAISEQISADAPPVTQSDHAVNIEILCLLRTLASPKHITAAHSELRRAGLSPWKP